jgi:ATP phosphoribosyltransferase regulatory subunit
MSRPKVFEKPTGVKDFLPEAVSKLRYIETKVLDCMHKWGYQQIITPTLEYYDTVGAASATLDKKLFKLLDRWGTTMVLRSDMTAPIARVVASLLRDEPLPLRLAYHSNVFRAIDEEAGREVEFFQTGGELVGDATAESDAEVIALSIACLKAAGIREFKLALGHVGFLNGLFDEALPQRTADQMALKDCLLRRDHVGYRELLRRFALAEAVHEELEGILRLRGGQEICKQARLMTKDRTAQASIDHLCEIWEVLQSYGVSEYVLIDLTNIGDFSYYTGMTFEAYTADLGFPVCSGGRYDNLLQQFGRPAPATGFALKTNRIVEVVQQESEEKMRRVLVLYTAEQRGDALTHAEALRSGAGVIVVTERVASPEALNAIEMSANGTYLYNGKTYNDIVTFT